MAEAIQAAKRSPPDWILVEDGELEFEQDMVNPFTYPFLVITTEPASDLDPNACPPVAGANLPSPFGPN